MKTRTEYEQELIHKATTDEAFRDRLLTNPRAAIEDEYGIRFPAGIEISVIEETPRSLNLVLPARPADQLSDDELAGVAGGTNLSVQVPDVNRTGK